MTTVVLGYGTVVGIANNGKGIFSIIRVRGRKFSRWCVPRCPVWFGSLEVSLPVRVLTPWSSIRFCAPVAFAPCDASSGCRLIDSTTSSLCDMNELQWSFQNFWLERNITCVAVSSVSSSSQNQLTPVDDDDTGGPVVLLLSCYPAANTTPQTGQTVLNEE